VSLVELLRGEGDVVIADYRRHKNEYWYSDC